VPSLAHDPLFKVYALCCIVLCLLLSFLSGYTGRVRMKHKSFGNPEDAANSGIEGAKVPERDHPEVVRVLRAHGNAIENVPMFFTLGIIYVLAGASPTGGWVCFVGFTAARVLHAIFHLKAVQPFRSIVYGVGGLFLLGMMALIGITLVGA
jgi:microsomal prostaglandin-E synthase 1